MTQRWSQLTPTGRQIGDVAFGADAPSAAQSTRVDVAATAKRVAATGTGALIGALAGGPIGLILGGAVGAAVDYYRAHKTPVAGGATVSAAGAPTPIMAASAGMPSAFIASLNAASAQGVKFKTLKFTPPPAAVQSIQAQVPNAPPATRLMNIATAAASGVLDPAAKAAASALYDYFQQYPFDRVLGGAFWQSPHTLMLVSAFQNAYNATDRPLGVLSTSGLYDKTTAAALTLYTHDPVAPDPNV